MALARPVGPRADDGEPRCLPAFNAVCTETGTVTPGLAVGSNDLGRDSGFRGWKLKRLRTV